VTYVEVLQGSYRVEGSRPSECDATIGNFGRQVSTQVCDGIGVDGKWEYQSIREDPLGCEPV